MIPHTLHIPHRNTSRVLAQSAVAVDVTGVTVDTLAKSITIPGGIVGPNGGLLIEFDWLVTNNANTKLVKVWANGVATSQLLAQDVTSNSAYRQSLMVINKGAEDAQLSTGVGGYRVSATDYHIDTTINTAVDWTVDFIATPNTATDVMTLKYFSIMLVRP